MHLVSIEHQQHHDSLYTNEHFPNVLQSSHIGCVGRGQHSEVIIQCKGGLKYRAQQSGILTETVELGVLVPYPEEGREAKDHRRPSALSHNNNKQINDSNKRKST